MTVRPLAYAAATIEGFSVAQRLQYEQAVKALMDDPTPDNPRVVGSLGYPYRPDVQVFN